jgi:hypothetical protein
MACPLQRTADGLEMQIGTNHFGHFLLGVLLAPALERGAAARGRPSRLVSLSSIGHRRSGIHWDDPNHLARPYDKWEAYGQAKTANALFAVGFERRHGARGIHANAVMPGGIMTPLQRHMAREEMVAMGWIDAATGALREGFKTPEQGASTSVWAALATELDGVGGLYLEDCAQAVPWSKEAPWQGVMPHALDPEAGRSLLRLNATAREAVAALDEVVWAINPRNDTLANVADYLCHCATEYFRPLEISCRLEAPPEWEPLQVRAQIRHQIMLAFKEALQNVVKHAAATEVTLTLRFEAPELVVLLEDNGCGIPENPGGMEKDGLANMRERLQSVGGSCRVSPRAAGGTRVEMRVKI